MLLRVRRRGFSHSLAPVLAGFSQPTLLFCCALLVLSPSPNVFQLQSVRDELSAQFPPSLSSVPDHTPPSSNRCAVDVLTGDRTSTEGQIRGGAGARSCARRGEGI